MSTSIHADTHNTVRISGRRFEQSPFVDCYATPDMVLGVYAGRFYPVYNGGDPVEGYWALRRKAALYDVPERPVEISGLDVVPFLEKIFARRIDSLEEGRGRNAVACADDGGGCMDGILFKLAEDRFWYVQPDGALETWLLAHSDGFNVQVSDPHSRVLQIQGPASPAIMHDASDGKIDDSMGYFHAGFFKIGGQEVYVSRTGWTAERGYEVYTQGSATDCPRLWDHLVAAGTPHGMVASSLASMEIRRIEAGILDNGTDIDDTMTPFEAGLGAFIDLDKEGFVGRAALLDASRETLLYGLISDGQAPGTGCDDDDGNHPVGCLTAGPRSPFLEKGLG